MKRLLLILLALLFVSCDKTPHFRKGENLVVLEDDKNKDPNIGVVVGFDTQEVINKPFNDLHIFFFDKSEMLSRHSYYVDMDDIAMEKMLMESGAYTVFAIFNTEQELLDDITRSDKLPPLTLAALINKVNNYYTHKTYPNMLTGMIQHEVIDKMEQVIIKITDKPITNNVTTLWLDLVYPLVEMPPYTKSSTHALRAVVELYKGGTTNLVSRKTLASTEPMQFTVTNGSYDVRVWSDYTFDKEQDLYYNTSKTNNISIKSKEGYTGNSDYKDAFAGVSTFTSQGKEMRHTHTLKRPFAKYQIVATDVEQYNAMKDRRGYPDIADLDIEIAYDMYLPTAYNMVDAVLSGSDTGYQFDSRTTQPTATEVTLATDYILVNGASSSVIVTIHIKDAQGETISKVSGNKIEYKANHLTTISGDFLTAGKGGIDIDTDWGPDINVEF